MRSDTERFVSICDLGLVRLRVNSRARRIILRIGEGDELLVTMPDSSFFEEALDFVFSRRAWIFRERARRMAEPPPSLPFEPPMVSFEEAAISLERRAHELAAQYGFSPGGIVIRRQRTVWGSCSATGRISLNWKAVRLPERLRDYVILHELVHLRHRNHHVQFWRLLDLLTNGEARNLDRELKRWPLVLL